MFYLGQYSSFLKIYGVLICLVDSLYLFLMFNKIEMLITKFIRKIERIMIKNMFRWSFFIIFNYTRLNK